MGTQTELWGQLGALLLSLAIAVVTWVTYRIKQSVDANARPVKLLATSDRDLSERLNVLEGRMELYTKQVNELIRVVNAIEQLTKTLSERANYYE